MQTCTMCSEDEVRLWGISAQVQVNGVSVDRGKSRVQLDAAHRCSRRKPSSRPAAQLRPPRLAPPRADVPASSRLAQRWGESAGPLRSRPAGTQRPCYGPAATVGSEVAAQAGPEPEASGAVLRVLRSRWPRPRSESGQVGVGGPRAGPGWGSARCAALWERARGEGGRFHLPAGRSGRCAGSGALLAGWAQGAGPGSLRGAPGRSGWGHREPAGPAASASVSALRHTAGAGSRAAPRAWVGCARWGIAGLRERRFPGSAARWGRAGGARPERCGVGPGGLRPPVAVRGTVRVSGRTVPCWLPVRFWLEKRL